MKILITEFMDVEYVELLKANFDVTEDHDLATNNTELKKIINSFDALIVRNKTQVNKEVLDKADNLKFVGRLGVGLDNIDTVIATNGKGTLYCLKEAIKLMKDRLKENNKEDCSIINISSIAAEIGMPNTSVYAYAKAGIASIGRVATIELNEYALKTNTSPIRVNTILPGVIRTPMHGRFLDDNGLEGIPPSESTSPEELAKCIITRLNEKFLMGSVSIIDGGYTAQ